MRDEWMWVQVLHWGPDAIEGILVSQPRRRPDLRAGSVVTFGPERIGDYQELDAAGEEQGNALRQILAGSLRTGAP